MGTKTTGICFAQLMILAACSSLVMAEDDLAAAEDAVSGANEFAFDLYGTLSTRPGNLFFSPYSIESALAMTYGGARGETAVEMAEALHLTLGPTDTHPAWAALTARLSQTQKDGSVQLHVANSLWPASDFPLERSFTALVQQYYDGTVNPLNYASDPAGSAATINTWVAERTANKIRDLIPPGVVNSATELALVNAIYFKGSWASRFDAEQTQELAFTTSSGQTKQVPTMQQKGTFGYREVQDAMVLEMHYVGEKLSMVLLLPAKSQELDELESRLTAELLAEWLRRMPEVRVDVQVPRFKINSGTISLNTPLTKLGMNLAFGSGADFSGITPGGGISLSDVLHQAFIEVNEEGTEAAAATAVIGVRSLPKTYQFRADRPFLFLIRHKPTGAVLFLGRISDPTATK